MDTISWNVYSKGEYIMNKNIINTYEIFYSSLTPIEDVGYMWSMPKDDGFILIRGIYLVRNNK